MPDTMLEQLSGSLGESPLRDKVLQIQRRRARQAAGAKRPPTKPK